MLCTQETTLLREGRDGLMRTSAGGLPPLESRNGLRFACGDERCNEHAALLAMHALWLREHNRLARELARADSDARVATEELSGEERDERLFQSARRHLIATLQHITYTEFLPMLIGSEHLPGLVGSLPAYSGFDPSVNPGVSNEFATAAFRIGHTLVQETLLRLEPDGSESPFGHLNLNASFFLSPQRLLREGGVEPLLRGLLEQSALKVDLKVVDALRNQLFVSANPSALDDTVPGMFDLAARNIQRGRDHGLAKLNQFRAAYGLARAAAFADITSDPEVQERLAEAYPAGPDSVDAWVGGLAEDAAPGAAIGETFRAVIRDQFTRTRDGDAHFHLAHGQPPLNAQVLASREGGLGRLSILDVLRVSAGIDADAPLSEAGLRRRSGGAAFYRIGPGTRS
mmetsp:Transcript_10526/g.34614  ORF Transcript_10526/g.34614 Transcript_10526/m.34614 type:complete len:401 (+) Transcript_10526:624-1826(+)